MKLCGHCRNLWKFGAVFFPHLEWQIIINSKKVQGLVNALGGHSCSKFVKSDKGLQITPKRTVSMKDERDKHVISLNISTQTQADR